MYSRSKRKTQHYKTFRENVWDTGLGEGFLDMTPKA